MGWQRKEETGLHTSVERPPAGEQAWGQLALLFTGSVTLVFASLSLHFHLYWEGPSELPERRSSSSAPRRDSAEPRPRGCSGLGEPRPALPSF